MSKTAAVSIPELDKIALTVLAYRPKPKSKAARKRERIKVRKEKESQ
jgi:hypothetical protein